MPTTKAAFTRWSAEKSADENWPAHLRDKAERVRLALATLDQKAAEHAPIIKTKTAKDIAAFAAAYADFKAL